MSLARRVLPPVVCCAVAAAAVVVFADVARLPVLFPGSDAAVLGAGAALLTYGFALMLPDRFAFTEREMLRETLRRLGVSSISQADLILSKVAETRDYARRMHRADNGFHSDLREAVDEVANDLDEIAARLIREPDTVSASMALIARASLAVEAVERHAQLRAEADEKTVEEARARVIATLRNLAEVMDGAMRRRVEAKMTGLEVATSVADGLYERMKGTPS